MEQAPSVRVLFDSGLAELVLCRPEASNAVNLAAARELRDATAEIASAEEVRAVLVRAEGRNFCVGGDLRSFVDHGDDLPGYVATVASASHAALENIARLRVPVVSAVQGAVAGAGIGLAFSADVVLIASSAKIRLAYTAVGLSPDNGSSWLLPRLVGARRALELALTNRAVSAEEAVAWGLASQVVKDEGLAAAARATARRLADGPAEAFAATKRLFRESCQAPSLHEQLEREADSVALLARAPGALDAMRAFLDR